MKRMISGFAAVAVVAGLTTSCFAKEPSPADIEAKYSKILRGTKITSVKPAPIEGMYEIIAGPNVFYFSSGGEGHLVFGNIVDKNGTNLTADVQTAVRNKFQEEASAAAIAKLKDLPLDKAVKTGNGPNIVIEFTDVDCPYCRKVDAFLSKRTDITRYTFLFPLDQLHPEARTKSVFVLNSKDQDKALKEVFSGKYDRGGLPFSKADLGKYPAEANQLNEGMKIGKELGVQGTPLLFVNGTMVNGADINKITGLLTKKQ